jgi:hypothetical protein
VATHSPQISADQSAVARWAEEYLVLDPVKWTPSEELWRSWCEWCARGTLPACERQVFFKRFRQSGGGGIRRSRHGGEPRCFGYDGVALRSRSVEGTPRDSAAARTGRECSVHAWATEAAAIEVGARTPKKEAREAYVAWCARCGLTPVSEVQFGQKLMALGRRGEIRAGRMRSGEKFLTTYDGLRLR